MKVWLVGGAVVAVGVAAVVLLPRKPAEVAVVAAEPEGVSPPPAQTVPPEPAPLPAVVEVTDLSALLDPPPPPADPTPPRTGVVAVGFADGQVDNWHVYPDPRARFADPFPPDDYAARLLGPEVAPPPRPAVEVAPPPRPAVAGGVSPGVTYGYEQRF